MANQFQSGTVVQLKSGGPLMTIDGKNHLSNKLNCEWFVDGDVKQREFSETSLIEVKEDKGDW